MLDLPGYKHLTYELGRNPVRCVVKAGEVVHERPAGPPQGARRASRDHS